MNNFAVTLTKLTRVAEAKSLEFRLEAFNVFLNHAPCHCGASLRGEVDDPHSG